MANIITDGNQFPYWSDAFGCEVRDRQHRKQLERAHGVVHATPEDIERGAAAVRKRNAYADRRIAEADAELARDPTLRRTRELIAQGAMTSHLPKAQRDRAQRSLDARIRGKK